MNPAEIVKKVLGGHELTGISYGRWECQCLAEGEYTPGAYRAHVAEEIVGALGLRDAEQAEVDEWFARFAKAQPATTPQAHVMGAGVEFGAEGEIRPSVHWCFCLKPCVEGGEEKR